MPQTPSPAGERTRHLNTALLRSAIVNAPTVIESLLDAGADPNIPGRTTDRTATHQARLYGSADLVQLLLDRGGDFDTPDVNGCTPRALARDNPQLQGTAVLRALGPPTDPTPDPNTSPDF
ncbi:MAG: hypothetical protein OXE84_10160 [Rhodobacteraceae bacterium]|nr:hypothetical protein [Paracoccaceae bacterium]MCY4196399.1 hypothetical protein [Paracoccaceae bacterium]